MDIERINIAIDTLYALYHETERDDAEGRGSLLVSIAYLKRKRKAWGEQAFNPSREGSMHCQSGSIASGGNKTYCTCDSCF